MNTLTRDGFIADFVRYETDRFGKVRNVTRLRDFAMSTFAIADAHNVAVYASPFYARSANMRDWLSVECMSTTCKCAGGTLFDGEEWNRDHIDDDGKGDAGDKLSKLIANGDYPADRLQFLCATCNQAKRRAARLGAYPTRTARM